MSEDKLCLSLIGRLGKYANGIESKFGETSITLLIREAIEALQEGAGCKPALADNLIKDSGLGTPVEQNVDIGAHGSEISDVDDSAMVMSMLAACDGLEDLEDCMLAALQPIKQHYESMRKPVSRLHDCLDHMLHSLKTIMALAENEEDEAYGIAKKSVDWVEENHVD